MAIGTIRPGTRAVPVLVLAALLMLPAWTSASPAPRAQPLAIVDALDEAALLGPGAAVAHALRAVAAGEEVTVGPPPLDCPTLAEGLAVHAARLGIPTPPLGAPVALQLDAALGCLLGAVHAANLAMDRTWAGVPMSALVPVLTGERETPEEVDQLLAGRDHAQNLEAAIHAAEAVDRALALLTDLDGPLAALAPIDARPILRFEPTGDTFYDHNYALIVDLEGDDAYDNNAAGVFVAAGTAIYDADDEYLHVEALGGNVAVGGKTQDADAVLSSSLLLDLEGNDLYGVKHPPRLKDAERGCGGEDVVPWVGTIGGGVIGTALHFDLGGDNTHLGRTQTQGAGHILGVGVAYSGPGRDTFEGIRATQGSGLLGGVGLLIDAGGPSVHTVHVPPLGVFNGDLLICDTDSRYAQGSSFDRRPGPLLPAVGILADLGGDDSYSATLLAQGFGQGPGIGLLFDREGADSYEAIDQAQGSTQGRSPTHPQAPPSGGLGALVDRAGDDSYSVAGAGQGYSRGEPLADPPGPDINAILDWWVDRNEALGLLLDDAGDDSYEGPAGRGDAMTHIQGTLGLFADAE